MEVFHPCTQTHICSQKLFPRYLGQPLLTQYCKESVIMPPKIRHENDSTLTTPKREKTSPVSTLESKHPVLSSRTRIEPTTYPPWEESSEEFNPVGKENDGRISRQASPKDIPKVNLTPLGEQPYSDDKTVNLSAGTTDTKTDTESSSRALERCKPSLCVFVASLPALLTDDELCRLVSGHFQVFGELVSVKVLRDPANRPYAFVQYTNDSDCRTAIDLGHDSELGGRRLRCEAAKVNRTLFFLFEEARSRGQVDAIVSKFGETDAIRPGTNSGRLSLSCSVLMSHNWFVKFAYRDEAIQAFAALSDAGNFQVEWAQNIDDAEAPCQTGFDRSLVYIGLLPSEVTMETLLQRFKVHGRINNVDIVRKPETTFAFITFKDEAAAASAVARDNHTLFMNKTIHVKYRMSAPKRMTRVILSPRVPVALAPPPLQKRDHYADTWGKWAHRVSGDSLGSRGPLSPVPGVLNSSRTYGLKSNSPVTSGLYSQKRFNSENGSTSRADGLSGKTPYRRFKENRPGASSSARYFIIPRSD